ARSDIFSRNRLAPCSQRRLRTCICLCEIRSPARIANDAQTVFRCIPVRVFARTPRDRKDYIPSGGIHTLAIPAFYLVSARTIAAQRYNWTPRWRASFPAPSTARKLAASHPEGCRDRRDAIDKDRCSPSAAASKNLRPRAEYKPSTSLSCADPSPARLLWQ